VGSICFSVEIVGGRSFAKRALFMGRFTQCGRLKL
jgi:hypothetical protein